MHAFSTDGKAKKPSLRPQQHHKSGRERPRADGSGASLMERQRKKKQKKKRKNRERGTRDKRERGAMCTLLREPCVSVPRADLLKVGSEATASDDGVSFLETERVVIAVEDETDDVLPGHLGQLSGEDVLHSHQGDAVVGLAVVRDALESDQPRLLLLGRPPVATQEAQAAFTHQTRLNAKEEEAAAGKREERGSALRAGYTGADGWRCLHRQRKVLPGTRKTPRTLCGL